MSFMSLKDKGLNGGIPKGAILMWSGAIAEVPSGWKVCNGANGTPDLRDRFLVGAGNLYTVGGIGGTDSNNISHTHGFSGSSGSAGGHSHGVGTIATGTGGGHTHSYADTSTTPSSTLSIPGTPYEVSVGSSTHTHDVSGKTQADGAHTHTMSGSTDSVAGHSHSISGSVGNGGSTALENRPPYYALAFIMKI